MAFIDISTHWGEITLRCSFDIRYIANEKCREYFGRSHGIQKLIEMIKLENVVDSTSSVVPQKVRPRVQYQFIERIPNPAYYSSLVPVPFRLKIPLSDLEIRGTPSVLSYMRNNVDKKSGRNNGYVFTQKQMIMAKEPRNITRLLKTTYDANTGERIASEEIETNDTYARLKRRKRALKSFTDYFDPLYASRKVTMLFITLTLANENGTTLRTLIDQFKKRCRRNGYPCLGYFWVMEVSELDHVHYHAIFAIDRISVKGKKIPEWWKMDELWGARTQVQMVKRSLSGYLSKYLENGPEKIEGKRMYGRSMPSMKNNGRTS